jgi:hypothetical protein
MMEGTIRRVVPSCPYWTDMDRPWLQCWCRSAIISRFTAPNSFSVSGNARGNRLNVARYGDVLVFGTARRGRVSFTGLLGSREPPKAVFRRSRVLKQIRAQIGPTAIAHGPEGFKSFRWPDGLAYRNDSLTKHLMHLPSQKFIE